VKFPEKGLGTMAAIWPSAERVKQREINILNGVNKGKVPVRRHKKHENIIFRFVLGQLTTAQIFYGLPV
jgi:hypothetical protein